MDLQTPLLHRINDRRHPPQILHARLHVQLRHIRALLAAFQLRQLICVRLPECPHRLEPEIQHTQFVVGERSSHASAAGVAADDYVLDFDVPDCELDYAEKTEVGRVDDVGDVAVREDVAWSEAQDRGLWFAGIGAA